jgi:hypothetical protein
MRSIKTTVRSHGQYVFPQPIGDHFDTMKWIPAKVLPALFVWDDGHEVVVVDSANSTRHALTIRDRKGVNYGGVLCAIEKARIDYRDICRPGDVVPLVMGVRYEDWHTNLVVDCWDGPDPKIHEYDTYQLEDFFACGDGVDGAYRGPDVYGVAPNVRIAMPDSDL